MDYNDPIVSDDECPEEPQTQRVCATQKVAISPFLTQKAKSVFGSDSQISGLIRRDADSQAFSSQSLLDLCSGRFKDEDLDSDNNNEDDKADEDEDEAEEEEEEEGKTNVTSFFDNEAELSGSEASSDEAEDEDDDHQEDDEDAEDLPSDEELKGQVAKLHHKQLIDEDKRELMIMKEMMFEDGDLYEDGHRRQKKFRWNFDADEGFVNNYINEDSDDNYMESDNEEPTAVTSLKMIEPPVNQMSTKDQNLDKLKTKLKNSFKLKDLNKNADLGCKGKISSLSSFVVRDQRFKSVLSVKNKRILKDNKSNKKLKSNKKAAKPSIFDFLRN